jgi:hypothetical protein
MEARLSDRGLAGRYSHSHFGLDSARPRVRGEIALSLDRRIDRGLSAYEGDKERVALRVDL